MKTFIKVAVVTVILGMAVPAFAITQGTGEGKTLADFQKEFSGTKPVIAWHAYQHYKLFGSVPKPTLGAQAVRVGAEEKSFEDYSRGTKPVVAMLKG